MIFTPVCSSLSIFTFLLFNQIACILFGVGILDKNQVGRECLKNISSEAELHLVRIIQAVTQTGIPDCKVPLSIEKELCSVSGK